MRIQTAISGPTAAGPSMWKSLVLITRSNLFSPACGAFRYACSFLFAQKATPSFEGLRDRDTFRVPSNGNIACSSLGQETASFNPRCETDANSRQGVRRCHLTNRYSNLATVARKSPDIKRTSGLLGASRMRQTVLSASQHWMRSSPPYTSIAAGTSRGTRDPGPACHRFRHGWYEL